MDFFGDGEAEQRQAHADEHLVSIANFPRGSGNHEFAKRVVH
jgi:hypothetical protein